MSTKAKFLLASSLAGAACFAAAPAWGEASTFTTTQDGASVTTLSDPVSGSDVRVVTGGYSISADGSTITGTLPPGAASPANAVETDPSDPSFAKRFKGARKRAGLKRFSPNAATRSTAYGATDRAGCVYNDVAGQWWDSNVYFTGWMSGCGYGTLHHNEWAKYFNSRTGAESDFETRAYFSTPPCRGTQCPGASHQAWAPKFGNGSRDLISRTHGWRDGGGDDTAWTYIDYLNN